MSRENKTLSTWDLTMLAFGTIIGGSFFLGSGIAIKTAGPGIIISYILGGLLVYVILTSLSEMTVAQQHSGSFQEFAKEMYGPGTGFVTGWVYWTGLILGMSSEATAVALLFKKWFPGLSLTLISSLVIIFIILVNLFGMKTLSLLENSLALIKISALVGFIVIAFSLIIGLLGTEAIGMGELDREIFFPGGALGIAGSMLIVMFSYAGFEIIGLAASKAEDPHYTIPRAIKFTVLGLVGIYIITIVFLLPLLPTEELSGEVSPLVMGLSVTGFRWVAGTINTVLIIAIISTMLAAVFGLGQMIKSLSANGYAPSWLNDQAEVPRRGILFSGIAMLMGVITGKILPDQIYLFLVSSAGFSVLFVYVVIMVTHIKYRRNFGCPPNGRCQLPGYPYTSYIALAALLVIIAGMPLIPGQGAGLFTGLLLVIFYILVYCLYLRSHPSKSE